MRIRVTRARRRRNWRDRQTQPHASLWYFNVCIEFHTIKRFVEYPLTRSTTYACQNEKTAKRHSLLYNILHPMSTFSFLQKQDHNHSVVLIINLAQNYRQSQSLTCFYLFLLFIYFLFFVIKLFFVFYFVIETFKN